MGERDIAIMEGHSIRAENEYFEARPELDDALSRKVYEDAYQRAWRECKNKLDRGN